jgi:hypothetical protein
MSKNNNVNPGQYKTKGRERQGEDIVQEREKVKASLAEHQVREEAKAKKPQSRRSAK